MVPLVGQHLLLVGDLPCQHLVAAGVEHQHLWVLGVAVVEERPLLVR